MSEYEDKMLKRLQAIDDTLTMILWTLGAMLGLAIGTGILVSFVK